MFIDEGYRRVGEWCENFLRFHRPPKLVPYPLHVLQQHLLAAAVYLGVPRQAVSAWFKDYTLEHPKKRPNAEQALTLAAFMQAQRRRIIPALRGRNE